MSAEGKTTLVVDAGSTKTAWGIPGRGTIAVTIGINALTVKEQNMHDSLCEVRSKIGDVEVGGIHWYGAGCATQEACTRIHSALARVFNPEEVQVHSDLVGAGRALFGNGEGIACILGTGSNNGLFRGGEVVANVPSLGYILGDEGSGVALGKRLISKALRGGLSKPLSEALGMNLSEVLTQVYSHDAPNRYIASFVPFMVDHQDDEQVRELVSEEFRSFAEAILMRYPEAPERQLGFIGSVAWCFSDLLKETLEESGFNISKIIKDPMEGLLKYHA